MTPTVLFLHALSTVFMTGLIWFVQVVHYPLKAMVDTGSFTAYQRAHQTRTAWIVGPPMLVEISCILWLLKALTDPQPHPLQIISFYFHVHIWK